MMVVKKKKKKEKKKEGEGGEGGEEGPFIRGFERRGSVQSGKGLPPPAAASRRPAAGHRAVLSVLSQLGSDKSVSTCQPTPLRPCPILEARQRLLEAFLTCPRAAPGTLAANLPGDTPYKLQTIRLNGCFYSLYCSFTSSSSPKHAALEMYIFSAPTDSIARSQLICVSLSPPDM
ncbi:uncharacterized protein ARB_05398 [Trichophyton benhamiae CBS 112371]|uniref:Uncharacterized protein n=1 Tax=Arthroderma benhamiae (strain ATCC MYA-4681 / CBS 112371) TaxID=663331 RepID=D4AME5_ARTBC|nr:uncharacterized protein ARB_05398 [Trichophyton benhamiae CBS 112371]EFE35356.1 hypothetical protein ARB_05398 [Trichophyton benhamiae CBS 112371]